MIPDEIVLNEGTYTFEGLGDHLIDQLNDKTSETFTIDKNTTTFKYTLNWTHDESFYFLWKTSNNTAYRLFGALNIDDTGDHTSNSISFPHIVDQSKHFVDLVIPEIPSIACKYRRRVEI